MDTSNVLIFRNIALPWITFFEIKITMETKLYQVFLNTQSILCLKLSLILIIYIQIFKGSNIKGIILIYSSFFSAVFLLLPTFNLLCHVLNKAFHEYRSN